MISSKYWNNKNVLITGVNGFIGGNLANVCYHNGANVVGIIRNQKKNSFLFHEGIASIRDYIFVDDVVDLYMLFAEKLFHNKNLRGEIFNAGTNRPKRVKEIVEKIYAILSRESEYRRIADVWANRQTTGEIDYQYMSYDKLNRYFGWQTFIDFDTGLRQSIAWYEKHFRGRA